MPLQYLIQITFQPVCPQPALGHQVIPPPSTGFHISWTSQHSLPPISPAHLLVEVCSTISLVHQPICIYLQSLLRVHSVLSYGSVQRVLRNTRPSTEPWRALPGTGFCHWSQPFQLSTFSSTSFPIKSTLHKFSNYDVVHQAWFPLLLFFRILNSTTLWWRLLPTPTSSISLFSFLIPAVAGHLPPWVLHHQCQECIPETSFIAYGPLCCPLQKTSWWFKKHLCTNPANLSESEVTSKQKLLSTIVS